MTSFNELLSHATPTQIAIQSKQETLTYAQLQKKVITVARWLTSNKARSVALHTQNSIDWIIVDLACHYAGAIITPIPMFFSEEQFQNVITSIRADFIIGDKSTPYTLNLGCEALKLKACKFEVTQKIVAPLQTAKVTFTSGTTGQPKGVCLAIEQQLSVAQSLVSAIGIEQPKHLCLLPLPTLLENIAGVYAPLLAKGCVVVVSDEERGFKGSKLHAPQQLLACISEHQPNTLILVPELLNVLISAAKSGWQPPSSLRFIAVGGSRVAPSSILEARTLGLPVCQGYGLSECASVVSLCSLEDDINSAGKLLAHVDACVKDEQLVVSNNSFLGYLNIPESWGQKEVYTGDLASIRQGYLFLQGRSKNIIINSYGRNISPEWVESELLATGVFAQAVVVGDSQAFCTALLVPASASVSEALIKQQIVKVNKSLPDYAQVFHPILLNSPMTTEEGLYTQNMRPRRERIQQHFKHEIALIYSQLSALEA